MRCPECVIILRANEKIKGHAEKASSTLSVPALGRCYPGRLVNPFSFAYGNVLLYIVDELFEGIGRDAKIQAYPDQRRKAIRMDVIVLLPEECLHYAA